MVGRLRAGTVWANNYRVLGHGMPFGGYKQSGLGRELGVEALHGYTEVKSVWIDTGNRVRFPTGRREWEWADLRPGRHRHGGGRALGCGELRRHGRSLGRRPRIAVLERAPESERGGATRYTGSWFRITEDRRLDPNFVETMESVSGGLADLEYRRALELEVPAALAFLEEHEIGYFYFKQPSRTEHRRRARDAGRRGLAIVDGLAGILERTAGVELLYETEAVRLSVPTRAGRRCRRGTDGRERMLGARAVVIASGGFEGARRCWRSTSERGAAIPVIRPGPATTAARGSRMAVEVGADTAGQFDMFHAEPVDSRATKPDPVFYPYPYGIVVNRHAKRFFDEGQNSFDSTFEALGYEIWRNQEQTAFFIGDQTSLGRRLQGRHLHRRASRHGRHAGSSRGSSVSTRGRSKQRSPSTTLRSDRGSSTRTFRRQEHGGPRPAEVELGFPARLAAVRRVPAHVRDHVHVRRHPHGRLGRVVTSRVRRSPASTPPERSPGSTTTSTRRDLGDPRRHLRAPRRSARSGGPRMSELLQS